MASSEREALIRGLELVHEQGHLWNGERRGTAFQVDFGRGRPKLRVPIVGALPEDFSIRRRRAWSMPGIAVDDAELAHVAVISGANEALVRGLSSDADLGPKLRTLLALPGAWVGEGAIHVRAGGGIDETRSAADLAVEVALELSGALAKTPAVAEPVAAPAQGSRPTLEEVIHALELKRGAGDTWSAVRSHVRIEVDSHLELRAAVEAPWPRSFAVHRRKHHGGASETQPELVTGADRTYVDRLVSLPEIRDPLRALLELPRAWVGEATVAVRLDALSREDLRRAADLAVSLAFALRKALHRSPPAQRAAPLRRRPRRAPSAGRKWTRGFRMALAILVAAASLALLIAGSLSSGRAGFFPTQSIPTTGFSGAGAGVSAVGSLNAGAGALVISWLCELGLIIGSSVRRIFSSNQKLYSTCVGIWAVSWTVSIIAVPFLGVLPAIPMICGALFELLASKPLDSVPVAAQAHRNVGNLPR